MPNNIDELNILDSGTDTMRSMTYDQFFGEMNISEARKKRRINLAEKFEVEILFILSLIATISEYTVINWEDIRSRFENAYITAIGNPETMDDELKQYIKDMSRDLTDSTRRNMGDEYNTSYDRARLISENESATVINHEELQEALASGKTRKIWNTMRDPKVRHTHIEVDRTVLPIDEPFLVGDSLMMVPRSWDMGADAKEVINCRCWCTYK